MLALFKLVIDINRSMGHFIMITINKIVTKSDSSEIWARSRMPNYYFNVAVV